MASEYDVLTGLLQARAATWQELRRRLPNVPDGYLHELAFQVDCKASAQCAPWLEALVAEALERNGLPQRLQALIEASRPGGRMRLEARRELDRIRSAARQLLSFEGYLEPEEVEGLERRAREIRRD